LSTQQTGTAIPILPCRSIDEQVEFYQALGFELTYKQAKPNLYACVRHPVVELHFFVLKQLDPANSYSMCYVSVPDVDAVYAEFAANLKLHCNKVPTRGLPRITKPNNLAEDRRFNLVDPAGNRLLIGTPLTVSPTDAASRPAITVHASKFANAYETAYRLTYAKDDPAQAAKVLDLVLSKPEDASAALRFKACVLRADIAAALDETALTRKYIHEAERLSLSSGQLEEAAEAAERLQELKDTVGPDR